VITKSHSEQYSAVDTEERRRSPRVELLHHIRGYLCPHDVPITLLNVSRGGFLIRAPITYPIGYVHQFRFTVPDRPAVEVRGRIVHTLHATTDGQPSFIIGLEFEDRGSVLAELSIEALLTLVTWFGH
jgi:hypothetical protein